MSQREPDSLLRLALTPRWLMAAGVIVLLAIACILLGRWQWDRTQSILEAERAAASTAIPIEDAMRSDDGSLPAENIGRPVILAGSYAPGLQVTVTSREHEGVAGVWIATAMRLADGDLVAVLRGWLPAADSPGAAAPEGSFVVNGVLQPDETFYADAQSEPGMVAAIAHDRLAEMWKEPLLPGYVVLQSQEPETAPAPIPVVPTVQTGDVPFPLQNFVYAFQWWLFALFGLVVFLRWLWLDSRRKNKVTA